MGCDANAHHTAWGACISKLEVGYYTTLSYLTAYILVTKNVPTPIFITRSRQVILDFICSTAKLIEHLIGWYDNKDTHTLPCEITDIKFDHPIIFQNLKRTAWMSKILSREISAGVCQIDHNN